MIIPSSISQIRKSRYQRYKVAQCHFLNPHNSISSPLEFFGALDLCSYDAADIF